MVPWLHQLLMSTPPQAIRSLQKIENLSLNQAQHLIQLALRLKRSEIKPNPLAIAPVVGLVFFEPSTRTRFSFEIAAQRLGFKTVSFVADSSTSVAKGESLLETLQTLLAMRPDLLVVRHSGNLEVENLLEKTATETAIINAGNGISEHPTQALLDAMTVFERKKKIEGEKILFVGDVEHSRVARSDRALFLKMGADVAVCAPEELAPKTKDWLMAKRFSNLAEGLKWCTVCIGLRIQKERHRDVGFTSQNHYIEKFRLDKKNLSSLSSDGIIMHPGPFVDGVDLSHEILIDPRCVIHDQVTNGVFMRMAVMGDIFGVSYS